MNPDFYLLDTNICVWLLRGRFHVDDAIDRVGWENCYISEITALELKMGVELSMLKDGIDRHAQLDRFLASIKILPISKALDLAAKEKIRLRLAGTPLEDNFDLLIGCTAIIHDMILVTENIKDFKNLQNVQLDNWIKRS